MLTSPPPYLLSLETAVPPGQDRVFPFSIPLFRRGLSLRFKTNVTFFVGENGSGKSTLLEMLAEKCAFAPRGGTKDHYYNRAEVDSPLAHATRLTWKRKAFRGFFLRAESFYNVATYLDEEVPEALGSYGGRSLHEQSHGESFLALFNHQFVEGLFLLDEPEAALSPARQLSLLARIYQLERQGNSQFLIATHSPILFSYPGATVNLLDGDGLRETDYRETEHYQLTRRFLEAPERYFRHLFAAEEE